VEDSCEQENEPSGSIKCWEALAGCTISSFSTRAQLREFSKLNSFRVCLSIQKIMCLCVFVCSLYISISQHLYFDQILHYGRGPI
jgi:hypothetical protein